MGANRAGDLQLLTFSDEGMSRLVSPGASANEAAPFIGYASALYGRAARPDAHARSRALTT